MQLTKVLIDAISGSSSPFLFSKRGKDLHIINVKLYFLIW